MSNKEILEIIKGHTFSNMELIGLLSSIKEESEAQLKTIIEICCILGEPEKSDPVEEYLKYTSRDLIIDTPVADAYEDYCKWCGLNCLQEIGKVKFSKKLQKKFNLVTRTTTVDGKTVRVYREPFF